MKIFDLGADFDVFDACTIDYKDYAKRYNCNTYDGLLEFDGTPQTGKYLIRKLKRFNKGKLGDYINDLGSAALFFNKKAIDCLTPIMGPLEIFPLECKFGDYWTINLLTILDCVDYQNSEFIAFDTPDAKGNPRIMRFEKYVFFEEKVRGYHIFKICNKPKTAIFVDQTFIDKVNETGVTGFKFTEVWDSEFG